MTEVYLAVYDLSQGMARTLSAQFLGPNHVIDMIPHTAILVFGKEYFFGGGIQAVDPHSFRASTGMRPVQTLRLGTTQVTQSELDVWCRQNTKFTETSYDLLHRNCNHFSHDCATLGLRLAQGVPNWILEVPQRFLSSPMGQMIRPMLEQMQVGGGGGGGGGGMPMGMRGMPMGNPSFQSAAQRQQRPAPVPAAAVGNPWANMGSTTAAPRTTPAPAPAPVPAPPPVLAVPKKPDVSILQQYSKPLISDDTQTIKICITKLSPKFTNETAKTILNEQLSTVLENKKSGAFSTDDEQQHQILLPIVEELWRILKDETATPFALLLLRLIVLKKEKPDEITEYKTMLHNSIEWMIREKFNVGTADSTTTTTTTTPAVSSSWKSPVEQSLAWCVLSNHVANNYRQVPLAAPPSASPAIPYSDVVDAAIADLSKEQVSVRQAASAFLYNYVLHLTGSVAESSAQEQSDDDNNDTIVPILCSCMESLGDEKDATTRLRRLLVSGRIVFPNTSANNCNETAKLLVQDLGFTDIVQIIAVDDTGSSSSSSKEHKDCQLLAAELFHRLRQE